MNRRGFLRRLLASTATIVVAPACVLEELPPLEDLPRRIYFDMGRDANKWPDVDGVRTHGWSSNPMMEAVMLAAIGYATRTFDPKRGIESLLDGLVGP